MIYRVQKFNLFHQWETITATKNLDIAIHLLRHYDADGEIPMRIIDEFDESFNYKISHEINEEVDWKKEGF